MRILLLLVAVLTACGGDEPWYLDGVPIIQEDDAGPTRDDMRLAVEAYRMQTYQHFNLHPRREIELWRELAEFRWTWDDVPGNAEYSSSTGKLRTRWLWCVMNSGWYRALTEHYARQLFGVVESRHYDWAEAISYPIAAVLCPAETARLGDRPSPTG